MRIEEVLRQFRLSGNYFRITVGGGVLERLDASLQLGDDYIFVSQRPLSEPYPPALILNREPRQHRSWLVYHFRLRDDAGTHDKDIADLTSYLGRPIGLPRHRVDVIWPPPSWFDADGAPVFSGTTNQLIVRLDVGPLHVETGSRAAVAIDDLGNGLYQVTFNTREDEVIFWTPSGSVQRLRFREANLTTPNGVTLTASQGDVDLTSPSAANIAAHVGSIEITVPSDLLWRKAKLNGQKLKAFPNGTTHSIEGPFREVDFGAFGSFVVALQPDESLAIDPPWYAKVDRLVSASIGPVASASLKSIRSKRQAIRWAIESKAMHLLPLVLSAYSREVDRGIS